MHDVMKDVMKDRARETLTVEDLKTGHKRYVENEPRDTMYEAAAQLVAISWGEPRKMASGLGVLLLTWNSNFYRYGPLDFGSLEDCIERNLEQIQHFQNRSITTFRNADKESTRRLFGDFLMSTRKLAWKSSPEKLSPVSVAKALHILSPEFFPLWDDKIAKLHGCFWWNDARKGAAKYNAFMLKAKETVEHLQEHSEEIKEFSDRPILKLIDEHDYSFAKGWLK